MYTITIPVKPYVRKFVQARYEQEVWEINKQERLGKMFYLLLERMPRIYEKPKFNLGDQLKVNICHDYAVRRGPYISSDSVLEFNEAIQLEIIEDIAMHAFHVKKRIGIKKYKELYIKQGSQSRQKTYVIQNPDLFQYFEKKEIIYDILKIYNISEDDLPFETVRKAWQRFKLPLLSA